MSAANKGDKSAMKSTFLYYNIINVSKIFLIGSLRSLVLYFQDALFLLYRLFAFFQAVFILKMSPNVVTTALYVRIEDLIMLTHLISLFFALLIQFLALPLAALGLEPGIPLSLAKLDFQKVDTFIILTTFSWPTFIIRFQLIHAPLI